MIDYVAVDDDRIVITKAKTTEAVELCGMRLTPPSLAFLKHPRCQPGCDLANSLVPNRCDFVVTLPRCPAKGVCAHSSFFLVDCKKGSKVRRDEPSSTREAPHSTTSVAKVDNDDISLQCPMIRATMRD